MPSEPRPYWRPQDLLTKDEAAAYTRVSVRTLERARARGELPTLGPPRKRLFRKADLDSWLTRGETAIACLVAVLLFGVSCDVGPRECHGWAYRHVDVPMPSLPSPP